MASGTVLVTGASGFLGQRLVDRLRELGRTVLAPGRADGFDIVSDDLDLAGAEHVFHLAARTSVPAAWNDPVGFHLANAHGTMRLLEACRRAGCGMTYVSGFVYGRPEHLPIAESDPPRPNNPYAFSKLMGEEACRFYASAFGVRVNIVRPFNIYGPGQDERFLLPLIIDQVVDPGVAEVVVKDLAPKRDFIHVDDVIAAILLIAGQPAGTTFNVGSGVSYSVEEIILSAFRAAGLSKPIRSTEEQRPNEIMDVLADTTLLRAIGWRPAVSFDQGMESLVVEARERLAERTNGNAHA
jgi:nucleoside-diphosphate-sugar epimerase